MVRKILNRRFRRKSFFINLSNLYNKYLLDFYFLYNTTLYRTIFENFIPVRQHYASITNLKNTKIFSSGFVLASQNIKLKYFKKTIRSNTGLLVYLQLIYKKNIRYLYLYRCLNFNYRQWLFLQKFWTLLTPEIFYLQIKKSYNTNYSPVKSIKKRVVKLLNKQT